MCDIVLFLVRGVPTPTSLRAHRYVIDSVDQHWVTEPILLRRYIGQSCGFP